MVDDCDLQLARQRADYEKYSLTSTFTEKEKVESRQALGVLSSLVG